jgi:hypothetical protein
LLSTPHGDKISLNKIIELELTEILINHGFSRIAIEADTLVVTYKDSSIRCDIERSWNKTIQGFTKYAKALIPKKEILQALISFISEKWLELQEKQSQRVHEQREQLQQQEEQKQPKPQIDQDGEQELSIHLPPSTNLIDYTVQIIKKTVKGEDHNIRLILYAGESSYTFNPLSIAIRAPTSEGKTHLVVKTLSYFPEDDVKLIGSMSPRVLIRQIGTLVDKDNVPLQPRINELKRRIRIAKAQENDTYVDGRTGETIEELEDELQKLYDNSRYIIDLRGKILIFLEPPHPDVWNILKPILSHDSWEIEHPYVDTDLKTKNIVTRGWPVCFFCTAKDESRWEIWPEIESRFIVVSPNMSQEKYEDANILTFQKLGLPTFVQEQVIVSRKEIEDARKCILFLKRRIDELVHLQPNNNNSQSQPVNPVWIPFQEYVGTSLPNTKGVEMRHARYFGSLLQVVAMANSPFQLSHRDGKEVVARPQDLLETLQLIQDHLSSEYSGIPAQKRRFVEELFYPCCDNKHMPDVSEDGSKTESIIAVTTKELADFHKQVWGTGIDPNNLQKRYLDELVATDRIGKIQSEIDKRRHLYYPLIDRLDYSQLTKDESDRIKKFKNDLNSLNFYGFQKLKLSKDYKEIPEDWLIFQILTLVNYRIDLDQVNGPFADYLNKCEDLKLLEVNDLLSKNDNNVNASAKRLTICEFISKYESPHSISILDIFEPHYMNFHSKIFGSMRAIDNLQAHDIDNSRTHTFT